MNEAEYGESLAKLQPGDEVVVFDRIFPIKRISKLYIFIMYGNHERRFRIKDGYEPGEHDVWRRNGPRVVPVNDKIRARIKLKRSREQLKAVFSRTLENLPQEAVDEMTARLMVYDK